MSRKIYYWKLRESELQLGERTLIMGILNITPDSFSDGGRYLDPDRAYARALELEEQGADIIDIGAESTKPGSRRITADEEWQRLVPVLKRLKGNLTVPLSIDTYKAEIAERAMEYGVQIINDPTGLTFDPEIVKAAANGNAGLILSHMRGTPETWAKLPPMQDPAGGVVKDLDATINRARRGGVDRARIVIDPGLGFGKRKEQNSEIIANLKQFVALDCPILVGPSRKHFLTQETETGTLFATAAAVTASILNGAHIVRVHDMKEMVAVVRMTDEIAAMPDIAARHAEATAERAAESKALRAARQGSPMHIEEPRRKAARPPLAPIVMKPQPVVVAEEAEVVAEQPVPVEATAAEPVEAIEQISEVAEVASTEEKQEVSSQPTPQPAERVLRPAAASKPYERTRPRENAREGGRDDRGDSRGSSDRTGWGPPRRRDESGPPARTSSGRFAASGPRPPYGGSGDKRSGPPPRSADGKFQSRGFPDRRFEGKPEGRPYPPSNRPDDRDRPARPPREGDDRPPRREYGPPRSDAPRSGPPRGDSYRSGPPRSDSSRSGPPRSGPPRSSSSYGPPRSGPPRSDSSRSGPPRSGPPRSGSAYGGPPRSGPPRSGPPRSGLPRSGSAYGPPKSGPPRDREDSRPPRRDSEGPRSDSRPPRSDRPPSGKPPFKPGSGKPPFGKSGGAHGRPFRKRP